MRLFVDANISTRLVAAIRELEPVPPRREFCHHDEKFLRGTPDPEWLQSLGSEGGWVILTGDTRIRASPPNLAAWQEAGLTTVFYEEISSQRIYKQAAVVLGSFDDVLIAIKQNDPGTAFLVTKNGRVKVLHPPHR
ncbi:MAG: hypothetical protein SFU57_10535 [Gemmatimonadales bacterium]|nr:hypothetical protein [Gemmatimonadales bacterium]